MSYEDAPSTKLLATHCAVCNRALRDAVSVEAGIGPDCREKYGYGEAQGLANWDAAMVALDGLVAVADCNPTMTPREACNLLVQRYAVSTFAVEKPAFVAAINALGFTRLAVKLAEGGAGRVEVTKCGDRLAVKTPYRPEFVDALKAARVGARWDREGKVWTVPTDERARRALWGVLRSTFAGALLTNAVGETSIVPEAA